MFKKEITLKIDTETAPGITNRPFAKPIIYDIGLEVFDRQGSTMIKKHYIIKETFKNKRLMTSAYYYDKYDKYLDYMCAGKIEAISIYQLPLIIERIMAEYKVSTVSAYNLGFDLRAIKKTCDHYGIEDFSDFFGVKKLCSLKFARQAISKQKKYLKFCEENGYMSKPNSRTGKQFALTNAEVMYRYVVQDPTFVEEHMGLPDVEIEKEIMMFCLKKKVKIPYEFANEQVALDF